jgi:hypothetical protein
LHSVPNADGQPKRNRYRDGHCHTYCYSHRNCFSHADTQADTHAQVSPDTKAPSDSAAPAVVLAICDKYLVALELAREPREFQHRHVVGRS